MADSPLCQKSHKILAPAYSTVRQKTSKKHKKKTLQQGGGGRVVKSHKYSPNGSAQSVAVVKWDWVGGEGEG